MAMKYSTTLLVEDTTEVMAVVRGVLREGVSREGYVMRARSQLARQSYMRPTLQI